MRKTDLYKIDVRFLFGGSLAWPCQNTVELGVHVDETAVEVAQNQLFDAVGGHPGLHSADAVEILVHHLGDDRPLGEVDHLGGRA